MNRYRLVALACSALLLAACGGKETMASKSASAYREATPKETPVDSGEGHDHGSMAATPVATDHGAHTTTSDAHGAHGAATEHAAHAQHGVTHDAHAGMQHDSSTHATMDHSQHGAMQHGEGTASVHGANSKAAALPSHSTGVPNPAATLRQDEFDAPAASAVAEAKKAEGHKEH